MRLPLFALLAALACALRADVFWRLPMRGDAVLQDLGGSRVYATEVQINGTPGSLSAYVFDEAAAQVSAKLAKRAGLSSAPATGSAFITCAEKAGVTRCLVLPAGAGEASCVALSISQTAGAAARAGQAASAWPQGLPALAAAPLFSAVCEATRTAFVTAETAAAPEAAAQDAAGVLSQAGWSESRPSTPTFRIFTSGRKLCVLSASRNEKTGMTTISVLQREGATP